MENSDAGGAGSVTRESVRTGNFCNAIADARREKFLAMNKLGIEGEAFAQGEAAGLGFGTKARNLRPGGFRVDEILGDRRNASPVVDAGFEQTREIVVTEVRRGLDVHVRAKNQAGHGDGTQHV